MNNESVEKSHPLLEVYGTLDEANCAVGLALAQGEIDSRLAKVLSILSNELFDVGADFANPFTEEDGALRVQPGWVERLEGWCDEFGADCPPLRSFLLPGGTTLSGYLNLARTITRRAERAAWVAADTVGVNPEAIRYLNRLSDLLFILGRYANIQAGCEERLWAVNNDERG